MDGMCTRVRVCVRVCDGERRWQGAGFSFQPVNRSSTSAGASRSSFLTPNLLQLFPCLVVHHNLSLHRPCPTIQTSDSAQPYSLVHQSRCSTVRSAVRVRRHDACASSAALRAGALTHRHGTAARSAAIARFCGLAAPHLHVLNLALTAWPHAAQAHSPGARRSGAASASARCGCGCAGPTVVCSRGNGAAAAEAADLAVGGGGQAVQSSPSRLSPSSSATIASIACRP